MIAKTLYGLEDVLAEELTTIGAENVEIGRRMVSFTGDKVMLYKANFYCRTALRILMPISSFKASDADTVYQEVKNVDWDKYLSVDKTFAVDAVIYSDSFNHSKFVAYRTKDAIADYFNEKYDKRPSVRVNNPDLYVSIHISHDDCTVSLDSSGESLHKRGYRVSQVDAPLNEVLAAGMILKTGWRGESNFIDPMCGSGTLLIEAAMIALNIAPGVCRKGFAFESWPDFDRELLDEIYNDESSEREFEFKCYGSDISPMAIEKAMQNVRSAGLFKYIELEAKPFQQYTEALKPGILVMNPPYGERISSGDIMDLYSMIGERLKHVFMGYNAWILSYKDECFDKIGLRPKHRVNLMNGDLECEYRCYELFEGKNKEYKKDLGDARGRRWDDNESSRGKRDEGPRGNRGESSSRGRREDSTRGRRSEAGFGSRENSAAAGFNRDRRSGERERDDNRPFGNRHFAEDRIARKGTDNDRGSFRRDGDKSFDRSRKPFDKDRKPFDRDRKPFSKGGDKSFDRSRKPFDKDSKPFDRDRKPFGKGSDKSFDRSRKPFDKDRKPFDRNRKPSDRKTGYPKGKRNED